LDRIQQILGEDKSKESVNSDSFINLGLVQSNKILPTNEINKVIDIGEQFNKERQASTFYRLFGSINPIASNALFNINGVNSWEYLNNDLFKNDSIVTLDDSIKNNLKEIDGWFGFLNPVKGASICNFIDMEPRREYFYLTRNNIIDAMNWNLTITYPSESDKDHYLVKDGLIIVDKKIVNFGGKEVIALATPVIHNLSVGNIVRLKGVVDEGDYEVIRLGLDNGDLAEYYFCIQADASKVTINSDTRATRIVNGNPSEYYFRKFKKIKTRSTNVIENDDYEISALAFSENIYTDTVSQFSFNEDIDISNLVDNLGRPLSELFLTKIKTNGNGMFSRVSSGIEAPFISNLASNLSYLKRVPIIQRIHNGESFPFNSHIPLEEDIDIDSNEFYGDVVEYNTYELKEIVLARVQHRFNTLDRETSGNAIIPGPRHEGYYYNAHDLIKIRNFSSYIEQGDKNTVGMPFYKTDLGDGRFLWRDLLDIGVNDGQTDDVNYPFLNGCHYIYKNYTIHIRRQDPFDNWGLFFSKFPGDPIGNTLSDNFKINLSSNDC
jgi:hypothetical protein